MNTEMTEVRESTLIPAEQMDAIERLDNIVTESREEIRNSRPMRRAFVTAKAMQAIEDGITSEMMRDFLNLMNSPLGFKTDRAPGAKKKNRDGSFTDLQPYHETTIKRCVIVALLAGAELAGNQFNIIAGQCYFTKEFMLKAVLGMPGLSDFTMAIGAASKHGDKSAIMTGHATWLVHGEEFEVSCQVVDGRDERIVVNSYSASGPDQLRGLGESKLLRRVVATLTGLNLEMRPSDSKTPETIDGSIPAAVHIEHGDDDQTQTVDETPSDETSPAEAEPDDQQGDSDDFAVDPVDQFIAAAVEEIDETKTIVEASKVVIRRTKELEDSGWGQDVQVQVGETLNTAKDVQVARLRAARST